MNFAENLIQSWTVFSSVIAETPVRVKKASGGKIFRRRETKRRKGFAGDRNGRLSEVLQGQHHHKD